MFFAASERSVMGDVEGVSVRQRRAGILSHLTALLLMLKREERTFNIKSGLGLQSRY